MESFSRSTTQKNKTETTEEIKIIKQNFLQDQNRRNSFQLKFSDINYWMIFLKSFLKLMQKHNFFFFFSGNDKPWISLWCRLNLRRGEEFEKIMESKVLIVWSLLIFGKKFKKKEQTIQWNFFDQDSNLNGVK